MRALALDLQEAQKPMTCLDTSNPFGLTCALPEGHEGTHRDHKAMKHTTASWGIRTPDLPGPLPADLAPDADGVPDPARLRQASGAWTTSARRDAVLRMLEAEEQEA
jgi:hypothetical protein